MTRHAVVPGSPNATVPEGAYSALILAAPPGAALSRIAYTHNFCALGGFRTGLMNGSGIWVRGPVGTGICGSFDPPQFSFSLNGTNQVRLVTLCIKGPCPVGGSTLRAWATLRSATVWVVDWSAPYVAVTGGSAVTPGWKHGTVNVAFGASDNVGISYADVVHGGVRLNSRNTTCNATLIVPCPNLAQAFELNTRALPDGRPVILVRAQDSASNWNSTAIEVPVDNTPPGPPIDVSVVGGSQWQRQNAFSVTWRNPSQAGTAPIAGIETAVCPATSDRGDWDGCSFGRVSKPEIASVNRLQVPRAGEWVGRFWLRDAAGNEDRESAETVRLRLDDSPPVLAFKPLDAADPTRIDVQASDSISAIARTELEIRRRGEARWLPIPTTNSVDGFSGRLDDETLPNGAYELRARAFDSAGNEQSTDREISGGVAIRKVPERINTRLVAGQVKHLTARRSRGGRRRTRRVIVVRPTVAYGRTIPISGRLTMPGGNPVAGGVVEVWELARLAGAVWRRIAAIDTDAAGRFKFKALRGPSRVLRFRYPGTPLVRARTTEVEIKVTATSTLRTSRTSVVNGDEIVLRGRVLGRPLPAVGKLVQLQAYSRGGG